MELEELLPKFERADWLIWTLGETGTPPKALAEIALICAHHVLPFSGKNKSFCEEVLTAASECINNPTAKNKTAASAAASSAHGAAYEVKDASASAVYAAAYAASAAAYAAASTLASSPHMPPVYFHP